jgi:glycosyltransferase involved in cell wall biosynthesis
MMAERKPFVVVCVPAFNEEATIARVVLMAERYVDRVFVCDDGSVDLTGVISEGLRAVVVTLDGDG